MKIKPVTLLGISLLLLISASEAKEMINSIRWSEQLSGQAVSGAEIKHSTESTPFETITLSNHEDAEKVIGLMKLEQPGITSPVYALE